MTDLYLSGIGCATQTSAATQKKVVFVQTQAENAGAQEISRQLALGAAQRGWDSRQVFFFRRTACFDGEKDVFFCAKQRPSSALGVLALLIELFKEFRREKPDVVVTLQHYGNVIAAPLAKLAGARLVIANQLSPAETIPAPVRLVDKVFGLTGIYNHIVVNSRNTETAYKDYPEPYARRLKRIDHGFFDKSAPVGKAEARRELGLPEDVELLGCAARLHVLKQVDLAIRLLCEHPKRHLALAGQGQEHDSLAALAKQLGVSERVHFLGELDTKRMGAFLASLDCFVFPSATETFGLAPVEAAQAGVPVIANDIEVLRDVLAIDGESCVIFVDAQDTTAFSAQVDRVMQDDALREALCAKGRKLSQRYPLDAMIDQYMALMSDAGK